MIERKEFSLDNKMIFKLIFNQAGSLGKALLECVQNSQDAKASYIKIDLLPTGAGYVVEDDGVGFQNRKQVDEWFATIGFDHDIIEKQDVDFARYGLGRCQQFSYAATKWTTNQFTFDVDVPRLGLSFDFQDHGTTQWAGCRIEGTFYERMSAADLNSTVRELTDLVKYVSIPVIINGTQVNKPAQDCKWTLETDDAYYLVNDDKNTLAIYNLGVKVCERWAGDNGVGGTVVTKTHLELNIARNAVIENRCPVWKTIKATLQKYARSEAGSKPERMTEGRRAALLNEWVSGEKSPADWKSLGSLPLIPTVRGHVSLLRLYDSKWTIAPSKSSPVADYAHRDKLAIVLSPEVLHWVGATSHREFLDAIDYQPPHRQRSIVDQYAEFGLITDGIGGDHGGVPEKSLTKPQLAVVRALRKVSQDISSALARIVYEETGSYPQWQPRKVLAGASDTADGWTNARDTIWINVSILDRAAKSERGMAALIPLMCHEYAHTSSSAQEHAHGLEFFERFHDLISEVPINALLYRLHNNYVSGLRVLKARVPAWAQRAASKGTLDHEIPEVFEDDGDEEATKAPDPSPSEVVPKSMAKKKRPVTAQNAAGQESLF